MKKTDTGLRITTSGVKTDIPLLRSSGYVGLMKDVVTGMYFGLDKDQVSIGRLTCIDPKNLVFQADDMKQYVLEDGQLHRKSATVNFDDFQLTISSMGDDVSAYKPPNTRDLFFHDSSDSVSIPQSHLFKVIFSGDQVQAVLKDELVKLMNFPDHQIDDHVQPVCSALIDNPGVMSKTDQKSFVQDCKRLFDSHGVDELITYLNQASLPYPQRFVTSRY